MRVQQLFDLSGRTALVTGGGRGIGRHMAIGLAEAGADVAVASRDLANCESVAAEIESLGRRAWAFALDLGKPEEIDAVALRALSETGGIDILVNNAGATWGAPMLDYPMVGWDRVFDINVRGHWQLTQHVVRHMVEAGGGSVVHVSSITALRGTTDEKEPSIAYSAAKGAILSLTRDMAIKLAPHGIRVNCISPGAFDTDMLSFVRDSEEQLERFLDQIPMKRPGAADDVKGAIVFLAGPAAAYVTGHNLILDGGWLVDA